MTSSKTSLNLTKPFPILLNTLPNKGSGAITITCPTTNRNGRQVKRK